MTGKEKLIQEAEIRYIKYLTSKEIRQLTCTEVEHLSVHEIKALSPFQIGFFNSEQVKYMSCEFFRFVGRDQLKVFVDRHISDLTPIQLEALIDLQSDILTKKNVRMLTIPQISELDEARCEVLCRIMEIPEGGIKMAESNITINGHTLNDLEVRKGLGDMCKVYIENTKSIKELIDGGK